MPYWFAVDSTSPKGVSRMSEKPEVPDVYTDQMTLAQTPYGLAITFSLSPSTPPAIPTGQSEQQVVVRMSLEHAKVMAMILRKQLKQYELEHLGEKITIPGIVYQQMGLSDSDW
jgi:hypothetical protein